MRPRCRYTLDFAPLTNAMLPEAPVLERTLLRDIETALDPFRRKHRDLQAFLASQLERLELQAGQVQQREEELSELTETLTRERRSLDEEWAHFDSLVETARVHALEVRQEKQRLDSLLEQQSDDVRQSELLRLHDAVEQAAQERDALEEELNTAQRKLGQLADVSIELSEARAELERLRNDASRMDVAAAAEWQRKLSAVEHERDRLSIDLQKARQIEADLMRQRDEDRRRYSEERTEWLNELRSMRRSLASPHAEATETHLPPRSIRPAAPRAEGRPIHDVLEEFEAVKRDSARHRSNKP
jgi:chromosome segregation ATPase